MNGFGWLLLAFLSALVIGFRAGYGMASEEREARKSESVSVFSSVGDCFRFQCSHCHKSYRSDDVSAFTATQTDSGGVVILLADSCSRCRCVSIVADASVVDDWPDVVHL